METNYFIVAYSIYLPVSILLTYYVARSLFNSGKIFMLDIFHGRAEIANATNELFKVGFYLLNIGYALMILTINNSLLNTQSLFEILSVKIGGFSIYLGVMLFLNLYLFFRGKRKSKEHAMVKQEI